MVTETLMDTGSAAKIEAVFAKLRERAAHRPPELKREWFTQSLFKSRSYLVADYIAEAEVNALRLAEVGKDSPMYPLLHEVVDAQLVALVQALYRG
ncbi:hypothetical protein CWE08_10275 [Aliidiomarina iranensis]|uniref:Uncharacterized protein n=1 Tax=Aliidiomarina iranensis TaxID=1434071 RepID=A0A432VSM2_9GAMM|nr:primosomal replication protein PriC [Aliidiomarina iranensis]RUO19351.1 hypothetical protein CWE08_10275 [Aliidiomarina iranensis]